MTRTAGGFIYKSDVSTTNWGLELDQGVGLVMLVVRVRFAVCTEVGVMADSALVANPIDVSFARLVVAQWPITKNAMVDTS